MKGIHGVTSIQEMPSAVTFQTGITTHLLLLLVFGHSLEGDLMKKNFRLIGNQGDMRNNILTIPIVRWILSVILRSMQFVNLTSFKMVIETLTIIVIMDLTSL